MTRRKDIEIGGMMEYTKGEWTPIMLGGEYMIAVENEELEEAICCEVRHCNAHLIAAAPDMYEALKQISKGKGRYSMDRLTHAEHTIEDMIELAQKALAKAEGK